MFSYEEDAGFVQDREDLISVLRMRFGDVSPGIIESIYDLKDLDTLERLILVASNAPSLKVFLEELEEGTESFRIIGDRFNPIDTMLGGD
ncbi:hypothetical protein J2Z83_002030 [Virgibacillus natechei]|uniref:Uncharacterized protein n=1 Tax=Virgibacillus natechei TaxID=1216297 RepID=A0ABS4IG48_9BACI|nr:hypothetical protein [Virgibacillus natechei]MBP1969922.1 hypothetical protein [Virgibacillus natechei]UZD13413.1 hypothetical protein OLD84_02305 [Virgibacillus natechei]